MLGGLAGCLQGLLGADAAEDAAEPWPASAWFDQAEITTACMLRYLRIAVPELLPDGRYPSLEALTARCEDRPEFSATCPADYAVPRNG
jgi:glutathione S-transferase